MYNLEMEAGCRTGLAEVSDTVEYCNIESLLGKHRITQFVLTEADDYLNVGTESKYAFSEGFDVEAFTENAE